MAKKKVKVKKIKLDKEVVEIIIGHMNNLNGQVTDRINDVKCQFTKDLDILRGSMNDVFKILRVHADQYAETEVKVSELSNELTRVQYDLSELRWTELMDTNESTSLDDGSKSDENDEKIDDPVNHPSHYTDGKYETIDFIEDYGMVTHIGTSIKYISRAGKKDEDKYIQDLSKADWYLQRYLKYLETKREPINVADYCKEKKLPLELTKVINCLAIDEYQAAHEILSEYIKKLKSNK